MAVLRPSHRFNHALKALTDLALRQATGPVKVSAIARRQGIPVHSLEQLFNRLRRKGIVQAERGPRGGYRLSRPAREIPLRAVFEVLQADGAGRRRRAAAGAQDAAWAVWRQVERAVHTTLEATTLETLAARMREQAGSPIQHRYTFHI